MYGIKPLNFKTTQSNSLKKYPKKSLFSSIFYVYSKNLYRKKKEMEYSEYRSQLTSCPFCNEIIPISETKNFYITLARAPYTKDHILVVPKKHVIFLNELTKEEQQELRETVNVRNNIMLKHYHGTSILLRDAHENGTSGKSIGHLHAHIVPDCWIGALTGDNEDDRHFFEEDEYQELIQDAKNRF